MKKLKRNLFHHITEQFYDKEFAIITGARQTGKTTILKQVEDELKQKGENVCFLTLEDPSVLSRLNQHPENVFEFYIRSNSKRIFILLDEIQYLENPSNFLKLLYDKHNKEIKIIATGSSAFYIDRKFKDSLAGRKRLFELYTMDFDEFLMFRRGTRELNEELKRIRTYGNYVSSKRQELESHFIEYLSYGGYPAVVLAGSIEKKIEILKEITGSFLKRDIIESNIQDFGKLYHLLTILAQQTGSLVNVNELSRLLKLSVTAVENYLYVLRKCFHIQLVRPFYRNIRKELIKMPKIYFHDLGFRNALLNQFNLLPQRTDKGMLIENYAFIRLRTIYDNDSIRFWRTADGHEIDFILPGTPDAGDAIEIKYDENNFNPVKYQKFLNAYPGFTLSSRSFVSAANKTSLLGL